MEINSISNSTPSPVLNGSQVDKKVVSGQPAAQDATQVTPGVQDKVTLSAAAIQQSAQRADATLDTENPDTATSDRKAGASTVPVAKAFVYGTLGLERPSEVEAAKQKSESEQTSDSYYNAGRWLAAAATVGTIVSLLA
jgi:hypothetical protein